MLKGRNMADFIIPILYLCMLVVYGFYCSHHIHSARDFALSDKRYSAPVLFATLAASFIGGGFSFGNASQVYLYGIGGVIALWGFSLKEIIVGILLAPKVPRFQGAASPGEIILSAYGLGPQIITGIFSILVSAGLLGVQIGAIGDVFHVFLNIPRTIGMLIGIGVIVLYTTLGGMRAIVTSDVIQFCMLMVGLPLTLYLSIQRIGGTEALFLRLPPAHLDLLNQTTPLALVSLFFSFMLGELLIPPHLQRLLMGKSRHSAARASILSGLFSIPFFVLTGMIGLAARVLFPKIPSASAMPTVIQQIVPTGIRGFVIASMMAIVISSADSLLNSAAISFSLDFFAPICRRLQIRFSNGAQLLISRLMTIVTGLLAVILATKIPNILDLLIYSYRFWTPLIVVPLLMAILGKQAKPSVFYLTVLAGGISAFCLGSFFNGPNRPEANIGGLLFSLFVFCFIYKKRER